MSDKGKAYKVIKIGELQMIFGFFSEKDDIEGDSKYNDYLFIVIK